MLRAALNLLIITCICLHAPLVTAQSSQKQITKEQKQVEKIKKYVFKSGIGPGNDIDVKLRDNTKLSGYVSEVTENYFVVTDPKTGATNKLEYGQVEKARLSLFTKNEFEHRTTSPGRVFRNVAIGFGLTVGAIALICVTSKRCME
jgi:hypothetical protein